jgi:hypothetical protein
MDEGMNSTDPKRNPASPAAEPPAAPPRACRPARGRKRQQAGGPAKAGAEGAGAKSARTVAELSAEGQQLVETLLVEGSPVEDVVEGVFEAAGVRVPPRAVEEFFRARPDVQQRRAQHLVETAESLKRALGDPESAEARLAEAAIFTGLLALRRRGGELNLKDAVSLRLQREQIGLRNQLLRLRAKKQAQDMKINETNHQLMRSKLKLIRLQLEGMNKEIEAGGNAAELGPQAIQKIQEIYGIATLPNIPASEMTR